MEPQTSKMKPKWSHKPLKSNALKQVPIAATGCTGNWKAFRGKGTTTTAQHHVILRGLVPTRHNVASLFEPACLPRRGGMSEAYTISSS